MRRHALTDRQWERLRPLRPPYPPTGRPRKDDRTIIDGILFLLRTGIPWRDLPKRFGPWQTVYSHFRRWQQAGVWDRILAAFQTEADAQGDLDRMLCFLDGTVVRAHQHAAGATKGVVIRCSAGAAAGSRPSSTSVPNAAASCRWAS